MATTLKFEDFLWNVLGMPAPVIVYQRYGGDLTEEQSVLADRLFQHYERSHGWPELDRILRYEPCQ